METLLTASDVIDALGGNVEVAKLTNRKDSGVVWNWRASGRLPANTYLAMSKALMAKGKKAPATLWGQIEPERAA